MEPTRTGIQSATNATSTQDCLELVPNHTTIQNSQLKKRNYQLSKNLMRGKAKKVKIDVNLGQPIDVDVYSPINLKVDRPKQWIPKLNLFYSDKEILLTTSEWLNDTIINAALILLKKRNPSMPGLQDVLHCQTMGFDVESGEFVQILHNGNGHWITVSNIGGKHQEIEVFDSLYVPITDSVKMRVACLLCTQEPQITLIHKNVQMQSGSADYGLFSIAFATALIFAKQPGEFLFNQSEMRPHLIKCFENKQMSMFPIKRTRRIGTAEKVKAVQLVDLMSKCTWPNYCTLYYYGNG